MSDLFEIQEILNHTLESRISDLYPTFVCSEFPTKVIQNLDQGFDNPAFLRLGSEFTASFVINVLKTWESNHRSQKKPCDDQGRQKPARLSVGPNPEPPEISCPNQEEQEPANLPSVKTGSLKSTLESPESNPDPPKANKVTQGGQEPANLLSCIPKLFNYFKACQTLKDNSPNGHKIAFNLVPPKTQTYAEVVAFLKEVTTRPPASPANDHQLMPVSSPEWVIQFDCSGDVVNSSGRTKHYHFCSSEQEKIGSTTCKTRIQGLSPASELFPDMKSVKSKEAKSPVIFHLNSGQVDNKATAPSRDQPANPPQALYCPPGAPFGPVHFTKYPPNPAYLEYNLENILIANSLKRTRGNKYI
ncbi:hypothetical protein DSO57_1031468 [Entomophthora muscae]|uniref:Uncharacterized protein n=1 Tax=Entomophthora muscae TaxID=34485 RepID=A0ACC2RRS0_9FUNG|nr:hypothetical protein DSO57_1031468 [Entomophthora muscae]